MFSNLTEAVIAARAAGEPTEDPEEVARRIAELQETTIEQVLEWRPMHAIRITIMMLDARYP